MKLLYYRSLIRLIWIHSLNNNVSYWNICTCNDRDCFYRGRLMKGISLSFFWKPSSGFGVFYTLLAFCWYCLINPFYFYLLLRILIISIKIKMLNFMVSFRDRLLVLILVYFCRSLRKKLGEYVETHITTMFSRFIFRIFPPKLFSVCSMLVSKLNENCIKGCYCLLDKYPSVFLTLVCYYSVSFEFSFYKKKKKK